MQTRTPSTDSARHAKTIEASKRVRWDIGRDVIRGRQFDLTQKFMPDGLSLVDELKFLSHGEQRFLGQVQGRTYANMFLQVIGMPPGDERATQVGQTVLKAYRWQYIVSGTNEPRFQKMLASLVDSGQMPRIQAALARLAYAVPDRPEVVAAMAQ